MTRANVGIFHTECRVSTNTLHKFVDKDNLRDLFLHVSTFLAFRDGTGTFINISKKKYTKRYIRKSPPNRNEKTKKILFSKYQHD